MVGQGSFCSLSGIGGYGFGWGVVIIGWGPVGGASAGTGGIGKPVLHQLLEFGTGINGVHGEGASIDAIGDFFAVTHSDERVLLSHGEGIGAGELPKPTEVGIAEERRRREDSGELRNLIIEVRGGRKASARAARAAGMPVA